MDFAAERPVHVDFGLAKRISGKKASPWTTWDPLTAEGSLLGTPAYMAPEQAGAEEVGPSADIYGLGATLYFEGTREAGPYQERPSRIQGLQASGSANAFEIGGLARQPVYACQRLKN